tara:strand:+ start:2788 stop:5046 length:2259 start_codon:yes stop_codon:yes gene_type:complete
MFLGGDKRNTIIAIGLIALILVGWQFLIPTPERTPSSQQNIKNEQVISSKDVEVEITDEEKKSKSLITREQARTSANRVTVESPRLHGSISLLGGRIDDITLKDYRVAVEEDSEEIVLFSPDQTKAPYFAQFGWTHSNPDDKTILPTSDTLWSSNHLSLTPERPITLTWNNGNGLIFEKLISIDREFAFTVVQRVKNQTSETIKLHPYSLLRRFDPFDDSVYYKPWGIFQDGALGRVGEQQLEADYGDLEDGDGFSATGKSGWLGITSKYFLSALIPEQNRSIRVKSHHKNPATNYQNQYQVDLIEEAALVINPGEKSSVTTYLFSGAKEVSVLDSYEEKLGVENFDNAVDFGFVWFLSKPLFYAVDFFFSAAGNFGVAILLLTICVRIILFPLANKAYASMSRMRKLQPQMAILRERFGDDKQKLNQEMMQLYRREKANPLAGCLPILVQIPVFFALYSVLFVTIEMRHAPFFWWIDDLSAPDPSALITVFGYFDWGAPSFLMIGVWPILFGITMWLQMKLNPQPIDPLQQKIMMALPFVFLFLFGQFPAGLVVYWTWNNVLSIAQQWIIMRRMGVTKAALKKESEYLKLIKEGTGKEREKAIAALDAKLASDKKRQAAASGGKKTFWDRILQTGEDAREQAVERRKKQDAKLAQRKRDFDRKVNAKRRGKKPARRKAKTSKVETEEDLTPKTSRKQRREQKAAISAKKDNNESNRVKKDSADTQSGQDSKWSDKKKKANRVKSRKSRKKR